MRAGAGGEYGAIEAMPEVPDSLATRRVVAAPEHRRQRRNAKVLYAKLV